MTGEEILLKKGWEKLREDKYTISFYRVTQDNENDIDAKEWMSIHDYIAEIEYEAEIKGVLIRCIRGFEPYEIKAINKIMSEKGWIKND